MTVRFVALVLILLPLYVVVIWDLLLNSGNVGLPPSLMSGMLLFSRTVKHRRAPMSKLYTCSKLKCTEKLRRSMTTSLKVPTWTMLTASCNAVRALTSQQGDELQAQQAFAQLHVGSGMKPVGY